jgi:predicted transcriptional regulator
MTATAIAPAERIVSVRIDRGVHERYKNYAQATNRSTHYVLKEAIENYIADAEKREAFKRAADASWKHYEETGLHLTAEEADEWFDRLIAGEEVEPPECHI